MTKIKSMADKFKHWEKLRDRAKLLLEEVPHLRVDHTAFEDALRKVQELDQEQGSVTGKLREITRLRDEAAERTRKLRNRVVATLQGHFGPESERLIEFGVSPRTGRARKKAEAPPGPTVKAAAAPDPPG